MSDKTMRWLLVALVALGSMQAEGIAAKPLPPRALAHLNDFRLFHGPGVSCAALSPDGRFLASAMRYSDSASEYLAVNEQEAYTRGLILWDARSGERLRTLRVPYVPVGVVFSPDSKSLAVACTMEEENKSAVVVFAVESGKIVQQWEHFKKPIGELRYSLDGKQLHIGECPGPVAVWDVANGKQLRQWKPPPQETAFANKRKLQARRGLLSPDAKVVAWEMACCEGTEENGLRHTVGLRVHDAATDKLLYRKYFNPDEQIQDFMFLDGGKRIVAYRSFQLDIWETATGKNGKTIELPNGFLEGLTPDGQMGVSFYGDMENINIAHSKLLFWDGKNGKKTHEVSILLPSFWSSDEFPTLSSLQTFSADGKTLLLNASPTLRIFDTATGKERFHSYHLSPITPRFSADGRTLFTSCGFNRCRWDTTQKVPALLGENRRKKWDAGFAYSDDEGLLLENWDGKIRLRETTRGRVLRTLDGARADEPRSEGDYPFGLFSPDGSRLLFGKCVLALRSVSVYDVRTGKFIYKLDGENQEGEPVFSPDGRRIAWADRDGSVNLCDAVSGKRVEEWRSTKPLPKEVIACPLLRFTPDGKRLLVAVHTSSEDDFHTQLPLRIFRVSNGREIRRFYANPKMQSNANELTCMVCSPDGRLVAVAEKFSGTVRLIELASGKVRAEFLGHRFGVHALAFAPDGQTLASGGKDQVVFLWDVTGAKTMPETKTDLAAWWTDLASENAQRAAAAIASFLHKPEISTAFIQDKLRPEKAIDEKHLTQWIADLDADAFETRESASRELIRLSNRVEGRLRQELKKRPTLEVRRRIEIVLETIDANELPPETLRELRAMEVLEHIGTPQARRVLEALSKGAAEARQTREAKAVLRRLETKRE